jgi:hypothetical protein
MLSLAALAHVTGDKAGRVYRRNDALKKRRGLIEGWCAYREDCNQHCAAIGS